MVRVLGMYVKGKETEGTKEMLDQEHIDLFANMIQQLKK